eukprot:g26014.t1
MNRYGYLAQQSIAFGYVASSALDANAPLAIEVVGERVLARVQEKGFPVKPVEVSSTFIGMDQASAARPSL